MCVVRGWTLRRMEVVRAHAFLQNGKTVLIVATVSGNRVMVELLLDRGADMEANDSVSAAMVCASLRDGTAPGVSGGPGVVTVMRGQGVVLEFVRGRRRRC